MNVGYHWSYGGVQGGGGQSSKLQSCRYSIEMEATPSIRVTLHAVGRKNKSIVIPTLFPFPNIYHFLSILDFRNHSFFMFQNFCPPTGRKFTNRYEDI